MRRLRTLHLAMLDAVDSSEGSPDSARYYAIHPNKDDGETDRPGKRVPPPHGGAARVRRGAPPTCGDW